MVVEHHLDPTPVPSAAPTFSTQVEHLTDVDACCVCVRGTIGEGGGDLLGATIDEAVPDGRVLVDLREATVDDVTTVVDLVDRLAAHHHRGQLAVTCPLSWRRSGLRRAGIEAVAPVFGSRGDALQALVMQAGGLGEGWTPAPAQPSGRHLRVLPGRQAAFTPSRFKPARPAGKGW